MWLSGRLHIEGRLNEGPRLQRNHKDENEAEQNKGNTRERRHDTSANQTPGEYKFAPFVATQQGRANQHEPACFGLSSSWSFPSRSGIRLHAVSIRGSTLPFVFCVKVVVCFVVTFWELFHHPYNSRWCPNASDNTDWVVSA